MNLSPKLLEHANTLRSTVISTRIKCIQFRPTFEEKKIVKIVTITRKVKVLR